MATDKTKALSKIDLIPSLVVTSLAGTEFTAKVISVDDGIATLRVVTTTVDKLKNQLLEATVKDTKVEKLNVLTIDAAGQVTEREYKDKEAKAAKVTTTAAPSTGNTTAKGAHGSTKARPHC